MDFIQHTVNWCKGEIFEGKMSMLFGAILLVISLVYWKLGSTPYAKAMFLPLLMVALLAIGAGIYLISANRARIPVYTEACNADSERFIQHEKERTEAFIKWYPRSQYIFLGVLIVGAMAMILSHGAMFRAVGIGLMILSLYVFVLDHFSEERAAVYHRHIVRALK